MLLYVTLFWNTTQLKLSSWHLQSGAYILYTLTEMSHLNRKKILEIVQFYSSFWHLSVLFVFLSLAFAKKNSQNRDKLLPLPQLLK